MACRRRALLLASLALAIRRRRRRQEEERNQRDVFGYEKYSLKKGKNGYWLFHSKLVVLCLLF